MLYISIHRYDDGSFYPNGPNGNYDMCGAGLGLGKNVNIPWEGDGRTDADYLYAFLKIVMPICYEFAPDLIIGLSPSPFRGRWRAPLTASRLQSRPASTRRKETSWEDARSHHRGTPTCCTCSLVWREVASWSHSRSASPTALSHVTADVSLAAGRLQR